MEYVKELFGSAAGIGLMLLAWLKYFRPERKSAFQMTANANVKLQRIIEGIPLLHRSIGIVTFSEITNGGGRPQGGKPLYMRVIKSTDFNTVVMFNEKFVLEPYLEEKYAEC